MNPINLSIPVSTPLTPKIKKLPHDPILAEFIKKVFELQNENPAELEKRKKESEQIKIHSIFRVDGKIVAGLTEDGGVRMESEYSVIEDALDSLHGIGYRVEESVKANEIERALRQKYGSRVSVQNSGTGLQMNRVQFAEVIANQWKV